MIERLTGENNFEIQDRIGQATKNFAEQFGPDSVQFVDGDTADWLEIHQSIEGISLFGGEEKMVVIRSVGDNKDNAQKLAEALEHISDTTELIVVDSSIDKRSALYKALKKRGAVTECNNLDEGRLVSWVQERAKLHGGSIDSAAARLLVEYTGADQTKLNNEIDKLINFDTTISEDSIRELVEPRLSETIFQLLDAMLAGQAEKGVKIYDGLRYNQMQPIYILTMIAWQLHSLLLVKSAGKKSDAEIAKEAAMSPFVIRKARAATRNLNWTQLKKIFKLTAEADMKIKTTKVDSDQLLQTLIIQISKTI